MMYPGTTTSLQQFHHHMLVPSQSSGPPTHQLNSTSASRYGNMLASKSGNILTQPASSSRGMKENRAMMEEVPQHNMTQPLAKSYSGHRFVGGSNPNAQ